eukprot:m.7971 g.7971  ORF g.7971 m.7971 type:complete len:386 (-) comp2974_c0_seq2:111-1268(-)
MKLESVDTPSLLVEKSSVEKNIRTLLDALKAYPHMTLRPHMKVHKSSYFVQMQAKKGVTKWCCQKLCEAEGILPNTDDCVKDLLITNEIIGSIKINRLIALVETYSDTRFGVLIDDIENCNALEKALAEKELTVYVLAEVNVGQNRCGVEPGSEDLVALAKHVENNTPHLQWRGIQCYHGKLQHVRTLEDRLKVMNVVSNKVTMSTNLLEKNGIQCELISGGGTGTFDIEAEAGLHNECQAGSFMFMDVDYGKNLDADGNFISTFKNSLFVHTMVMSKSKDHLVLDAGLKALSIDSGLPSPVLLHSDGTFTQLIEQCKVENGGDEHTILWFNDQNSTVGQLQIGDTIQLIPGHCDPTVNMHSTIVVIENGHVVEEVNVEGRGVGK